MTDPTKAFQDAMRAAGLVPPRAIIADGVLHRCDADGGTSGKGDGAYILHLNGIPTGGFQNWRVGEGWQTWSLKPEREFSSDERRAFRVEIARQRKLREEETANRRAEAATRADAILSSADPAPADHQYLARKRVGAHGLRLHNDALVVPLRDTSGALHNLQFIGVDGRKVFLRGGAVSGYHHAIGEPGDVVLLCEGFATGATLHEATGHQVLVAFDAGNLSPVAKAWRTAHPDMSIVLCADDDHRTTGNPGITKARAAADAVGGIIAVPMFPASRPEKATDWNDLAALVGIDDVKRQMTAILSPAGSGDAGSWIADALVSSRGETLSILANALLALRRDPAWRGVLAYDEMQCTAVLRRPIPRFTGTPPKASGTYPRPLTDEDATTATEWLQIAGLPKIGRDVVFSAVEVVARENGYHPVKQYLDGLTWDGVARIDHWLSDFMGAVHDAYTSTVGRLFLIAMAARIYQPGCKADHTPLFEGGQGAGKSTICAILGGSWYSDNLPHDVGSKDAAQHLRGKWLIEMAEMASMKKSESEELKAFITRREEKYRPSFGRKEVVEPRQCMFIGTTNKTEYLRDETGARRFWPVKVGVAGEIDTAGLSATRDQLFAEAVHRFKTGESWWPDREFEAQHIAPEQERRFEVDAWETAIAAYLESRDRTTVIEVARDSVFLETSRLSIAEQRRVTTILRRLGWEPKTSHGNRWWQKGGVA